MAFYTVKGGKVAQILPDLTARLEREIQDLVEANLESVFGVRFVAREFSTGAKHGGRIDTLGLDQDGSPVILEYKRATNPTVMIQGLFYLDWLLDHRGDFEVAARGQLGNDVEVVWDQPRLILLAEGFNKYDHYAVNRIDGRIELWTYTFYEGGYLRVEPVDTEEAAETATRAKPKKTSTKKGARPKGFTLEHHLAKMSKDSKALFESLREQILVLGDDVSERFMNQYVGYRRQKNFVEIVGQKKGLNVFIDGPVVDDAGLGEDVSNVGHWGTGNLRVKVADMSDVDKVFGLIKQAYELQQ